MTTFAIAIILLPTFSTPPATPNEPRVPREAQEQQCGLARIPARIAATLASRYPGWKIVTEDDFDPDTRKLWASTHPGACPGIAEGDFLPERPRGTAVLLERESAGVRYETVLLFVPERSDLQVLTLVKTARSDVTSEIFSVPAGTYKSAEDDHAVKTAADGVVYGEPEAAAELLYWSGTGFASLAIAE